jgi:hypothetical protein
MIHSYGTSTNPCWHESSIKKNTNTSRTIIWTSFAMKSFYWIDRRYSCIRDFMEYVSEDEPSG